MSSAEMEVRTYADICVALADGTTPRAEVLAAHGLDEDSWTAAEDAWQERLSAAIEEQDGETVPPLVVALDAAFAEARRRLAPEDVLSLERFAEATLQLGTARDP